MRLFALNGQPTENMERRISLMATACKDRNVEMISLDSTRIDHSNLPKLEPGDALFNLGRGSQMLEFQLIADTVVTFYVKNPTLYSHESDTTKYSLLLEKHNFPAPKTIWQFTNDRVLLEKYADHLNGFPLVLKVVAGTGGVGVIRIDSFPSLLSLADYLISIGANFILREYLEPKEVCRAIVLGDRVIAAREKPIPQYDFRTDAMNYAPIPKEYPEEFKELAVKASHCVNSEFSGVDILIDKKGDPHILEVNFPFDFTPSLEVGFGIDVCGMAVDHLIDKSNLSVYES